MPTGTWAFLQETVIYEYMMHRFDNNSLYLSIVIHNGKPVLRPKQYIVTNLEKITDTFFPDVNLIQVKNDSKGARPAEVKFSTSNFEYHNSKKHVNQYSNFKNHNGCIIVLKHDYLPKGLCDNYLVDVFELDYIDFISFATENFKRFLNRQIKKHEFKKVWLMAQSKNFYYSEGSVLPACESGIWCPSDGLTGFELAPNDKVIFVKTKGASKQNVNKFWSGNKVVYENWFLDELFVGKVVSPMMSRSEYCACIGKDIVDPLWYDETQEGKSDKRVIQRATNSTRWNRVFRFEPQIRLSNLDINLKDFCKMFPDFTQALLEIYISPVSREISNEMYTSIIEHLSVLENNKRLAKPSVISQQPYVPSPIMQ